ncbi:MAG TPA: PIN domain protein [Spirochaetota bacterium]|nr:PIN domain protein [Spirochaetota bacterium]HSA15261.1 PIN domain protein [Spirochaetota bacterium]
MKQVIIYLDNCCFNRPYDDQSHLSVNLETEAKLAIQELINDNKLNLVWSFILDFENNANPDEIIRDEIFLWRIKASSIIFNNGNIINTGKKLKDLGFSNKDSLHIASAIEGKADYFITVDKKILSRRHHVKELLILSPIDFITLLEDLK